MTFSPKRPCINSVTLTCVDAHLDLVVARDEEVGAAQVPVQYGSRTRRVQEAEPVRRLLQLQGAAGREQTWGQAAAAGRSREGTDMGSGCSCRAQQGGNRQGIRLH